MKRFLLVSGLAVLLIVAVALSGCRAYIQHPGAASSFDSHAYDALLVANDSINSAKAALSTGSLPVNSGEYLNILIKSYNAADALYKVYHDAAVKGQDTSQMMANLQLDLNVLATDLASFKKVSVK
jgi:hypothetical protein